MAHPSLFRTIREQIVDRLRTDVLSGNIPKGSQLKEQELAQRYGVSRGPIRDALLQLTQEGLLVSEPNCGVKVSHKPNDKVQPLVVELRLRTEIFALKLLFEKRTDEQIQKLGNAVLQLKNACEKGDIASVVECDMAFHRNLIEFTEQEDLISIWLPIVVRMMLHYSRHENLMESCAEHEAILNAIRRKDLDGAIEALKLNIQ